MTARIVVRLTPRAGADEIVGAGPEGSLLVRVRAAPAGGAANRALRRLLADELHVPLGSVALVAGAASRSKRVEIAGRTAAGLGKRWPGLEAREAR